MSKLAGVWIACLLGACSSDSSPARPASDSGAVIDSSASDAGWPDAAASDAASSNDAVSTLDGSPADPCPALSIPTTCFGREVVFREWGIDAKGDGTYFSDQAPQRLGFTRAQGKIWIAKFQTEDNSYRGRISAYGDAHPGVAWISDQPCDAAFGVANKLVAWGNLGGGTLDFVVVRSSDEAKLDTDPALASWAKNPRLRAGSCYYVAFENVTHGAPATIDESYIETVGDECGISGDGTCWYLAMDFGHLLHDIETGQLGAGNVIPGLTEL